MAYLETLESSILGEIRRKSRNLIYQRDPEAWLWDILGVRAWSKQAEILHSFAENQFTLVKSCNGVGKTQIAGWAVCWFGNVHPPLETSIMVSAPVSAQIDEMMFRYLRAAYQMSVERGKQLVGEIMPRQPRWVVADVYKHDLVVPKRPADQNLLSSFQGVHNDHVGVVLDEAGGLAEDFFIGANAVTTNEDAHILAIGNPDRLNTAFHRRFTDRQRFSDWNAITIGANDTPNFTGEMIYPENPELDRKIKARLVQVQWAEMMRRSALPGVVAAKVDGEFPDADDNTVFDADTKTRAWETEIEPASTDYRWLGVDLSYSGEDQCVAYLNHGGKIRLVDTWNRYSGTEHMESARRIHRLAAKYEATEVRVDSAGTGSGVYSNLKTEAEFAKRRYVLVGILGANASPNRNVWLNARAWHYDSFRRGMREGRIDLDMMDDGLRQDMDVQSWFPTGRGQIQITSKAELKKQGLHSPDHLDAAIYSAIDLLDITDGPGAGLEPGDEMWEDPWAYASEGELAGVGMPL
jgi:hypothetical protein